MDKTICIAGKNQIAVSVLDYILNLGIDQKHICACINGSDSGKNNWQPSLLYHCKRKNIRVVKIQELYQIENLFLFSLEFDKIINTNKFRSKNLFNLHFSKLPRYKGMYTSVYPILNSDRTAGVSLHIIDNGIDTGDLLDQMEFEISNLTAFQLYQQFTQYGLELIKKVFLNILKDNYSYSPQPFQGSSYNSKSAIDFKNKTLDINKTAFEIEREIRAFRFRPYQLIKYNNKPISHAKINNQRSKFKAGSLIEEKQNSVVLNTVDYNVELFYDRLENILETIEINDYNKLSHYIYEGYELNDFGENGWTPLIVAAYNQSHECFDLLVNNGANIDAQNFNGTSVLMYAMTTASLNDNFYVMHKLLKLGANPNHRDYRGISVLDYAKNYNNKKTIELLSQYLNL